MQCRARTIAKTSKAFGDFSKEVNKSSRWERCLLSKNTEKGKCISITSGSASELPTSASARPRDGQTVPGQSLPGLCPGAADPAGHGAREEPALHLRGCDPGEHVPRIAGRGHPRGPLPRQRRDRLYVLEDVPLPARPRPLPSHGSRPNVHKKCEGQRPAVQKAGRRAVCLPLRKRGNLRGLSGDLARPGPEGRDAGRPEEFRHRVRSVQANRVLQVRQRRGPRRQGGVPQRQLLAERRDHAHAHRPGEGPADLPGDDRQRAAVRPADEGPAPADVPVPRDRVPGGGPRPLRHPAHAPGQRLVQAKLDHHPDEAERRQAVDRLLPESAERRGQLPSRPGGPPVRAGQAAGPLVPRSAGGRVPPGEGVPGLPGPEVLGGRAARQRLGLGQGTPAQRAGNMPRRGRERVRLPAAVPTDQRGEVLLPGDKVHGVPHELRVQGARQNPGQTLQPLRGRRGHRLLPH